MIRTYILHLQSAQSCFLDIPHSSIIQIQANLGHMSKPDSSNSYKTRLKGGGANKLKFGVKKSIRGGTFWLVPKNWDFGSIIQNLWYLAIVCTYTDRKLKYFIMKAMYLSSKIKVITPDTVCYMSHTFSYIYVLNFISSTYTYMHMLPHQLIPSLLLTITLFLLKIEEILLNNSELRKNKRRYWN